jgi:hypothetical protein
MKLFHWSFLFHALCCQMLPLDVAAFCCILLKSVLTTAVPETIRIIRNVGWFLNNVFENM